MENIVRSKVRMGQMKVRDIVRRFLNNGKGDLLGTIGIMMVITLAIVTVHGLIKGWLPDFVGRVFALLDGMI